MNVKKFFNKYFKLICSGLLGCSIFTAVALSVPTYAWTLENWNVDNPQNSYIKSSNLCSNTDYRLNLYSYQSGIVPSIVTGSDSKKLTVSISRNVHYKFYFGLYSDTFTLKEDNISIGFKSNLSFYTTDSSDSYCYIGIFSNDGMNEMRICSYGNNNLGFGNIPHGTGINALPIYVYCDVIVGQNDTMMGSQTITFDFTNLMINYGNEVLPYEPYGITIPYSVYEKVQMDTFTKAYEEGVQEGGSVAYEEGYDKGYDDGLFDGGSASYLDGYDKGYDDGYKKGYADGVYDIQTRNIWKDVDQWELAVVDNVEVTNPGADVYSDGTSLSDDYLSGFDNFNCLAFLENELNKSQEHVGNKFQFYCGFSKPINSYSFALTTKFISNTERPGCLSFVLRDPTVTQYTTILDYHSYFDSDVGSRSSVMMVSDDYIGYDIVGIYFSIEYDYGHEVSSISTTFDYLTYKKGYDIGYKVGYGEEQTDTYINGYTAGKDYADNRLNTDSTSYKSGYSDGYAKANDDNSSLRLIWLLV